MPRGPSTAATGPKYKLLWTIVALNMNYWVLLTKDPHPSCKDLLHMQSHRQTCAMLTLLFMARVELKIQSKVAPS